MSSRFILSHATTEYTKLFQKVAAWLHLKSAPWIDQNILKFPMVKDLNDANNDKRWEIWLVCSNVRGVGLILGEYKLPERIRRMIEKIRADVEKVYPEIRDIRRKIHRHPELRMKEFNTATIVKEELEKLGIEVFGNYAGTTAVLARIKGRKQGPVRAFRADMDALPIKEETGLPYASEVDGVMHACGHDFNTSIVLGLAHVLKIEEENLSGEVIFVFQPGEEGGFGGKILAESGFIERFGVSYIVAQHLYPDVPLGKIGYRKGLTTANADGFTITVKGKGGHGARPDRGVDPIVVASHITIALSTICAREVSPLDPTVITVGSVHGGTAGNIIPDTATLVGTIRTLGEKNRKFVANRLQEVARNIASGFRAKAEINIGYGYPSLSNDPEVTERLKKAGEVFLGKENVMEITEPTMGAEDFAFYLKKIPGTFYRLGVGPCEPLHSARFSPGEEVLKIGIGINSTMALLFP